MARLPFLTDAQGKPKNLRRKIAPQPTLGLPVVAAASHVEFRTNGGRISPSRASIPRAVVARTRQAPLPGKMIVDGGPIAGGDIDPANRGMLRLLANFFGNYSVELIAETRGGGGDFYRWIFAADQATAAAGYLSLVEDNDVLPRFLAYDLACNSVSGAAAAGENATANFGFIGGSHTFYEVGTQTVGAASEMPILTGTWSGNWALDATDQDLFLRVEAQDADEVTFTAKVSAAASYGTIDFVVPRSNPGGTKIVDGTSGEFLAGENSYTETPKVYVGAGTYVVNDVFRFDKRTDSFVSVLGIERPISSVNTEFWVDGTRFRAEGGWNYESAWEQAAARPDVSEVQGTTPIRSGLINTTLTPTRELADLELQRMIHQASSVAAYIDAQTDVYITDTIRRFRWMAVFPRLLASGSMFGPDEGAGATTESVTLEAGTPESTYTITDVDQNIEIDADFAIVIENDISAL